MQQPILITGIGTAIGKTLIAAMVTEALEADYWKPVQAGWEEGTDAGFVGKHISNPTSVIHKEAYLLQMPASPHIAAEKEGIRISIDHISKTYTTIAQKASPRQLVIEGAGGLLVPLNPKENFADLAEALQAKLILVSRNYLGSINHSLLTAAYCKNRGLDVLGWVFNDDYLSYEAEIVTWSGYPSLGSIPALPEISPEIVRIHALGLLHGLREKLKPLP